MSFFVGNDIAIDISTKCLYVRPVGYHAVFIVAQELIAEVYIHMVNSIRFITKFGLAKKNRMPYNVEIKIECLVMWG